MAQKLINYALFQAGWFACVWGAGTGRPLLGLLVVAAAAGVHLLQARQPGREMLLLSLCAGIGLVFDSLLLWSGWVSYPNGNWVPGLAPFWIVALWVLFGTTLNLSMVWLRGRSWLAAVFGMIGGPLSYLAGQGLGAMQLLQPSLAITTLAVGWGLVLPALFKLASRLDGFTTTCHPEFVQADWRRDRASGHA